MILQNKLWNVLKRTTHLRHGLWMNYSLAFPIFSKWLNITNINISSTKMVFMCCGLTGFQLKTVNQEMFINSSTMHCHFFGSSFAQSLIFFYHSIRPTHKNVLTLISFFFYSLTTKLFTDSNILHKTYRQQKYM